MMNEELLAAILKDGVARFLVCGSELLGKLWTDGEDAVQGKSLVVKFDPSLPPVLHELIRVKISRQTRTLKGSLYSKLSRQPRTRRRTF